MKKLLYPACFYPCEEQEGYTVVVPDLPGCVTQGKSLIDAIGMAVDAASGWVLDEMEDGKPIPPASKIEDVQADERPGGFVNLIVLDMDTYAEKYGENNWQLGQPMHVLMDSGMRHNCKAIAGITDEPHVRATAWNYLCAIWMDEHLPDMRDLKFN